MQAALDRLVRSPLYPGAALSRHGPGGAEHFHAGNLTPDTPVFFASATKLPVTVLLRQLEAEGLSLDTPFADILPDVSNLLVVQGIDWTGKITLRHLMSHVSGLPDYLGSANPKTGLMGALLAGHDRAWSFDDVLVMARALPPVGLPGQMRRAVYSDTNFQILGRVVETLHGQALGAVLYKRLFQPLGLCQTWLFDDADDPRPTALRYRRAALDLPKAMVSFAADGGIVSTTREGLALVQAIFAGTFCDPARLIEDPFRPVFFPLHYGTGVMRFQLPRWMTLFRRLPAFYGHSGHSGALLFHAPGPGVSVAATVNQVDSPSTVYRLLARAA